MTFVGINVLKRHSLPDKGLEQNTMKRKIRQELTRLAEEILADRELKNLPDLYDRSKALYEKLAVLKFIEDNLNNLEVDVSKSEMGSRFEHIASAVISENTKVPESNPHQEDIMTPGIDTIKHMVSEMTDEEDLDEVLIRLLRKRGIAGSFDKTPKTQPVTANEGPKSQSLNDAIARHQITIGLNDRLAFVNHLFGGSSEAFNQTLSKLNRMESQEQSLAYIANQVKPEFNNWQGKETYEERFTAFITKRFS